MIIASRCVDTETLFHGGRVKRFIKFDRIALRKLRQLQVSDSLSDLRVPPGNRLEALLEPLLEPLTKGRPERFA